MVKASRHFHPSTRARCRCAHRIHSRTPDLFSSRQAQYDVIVSEPSNPGVSGVSGLFSTEFYRDVRRYLRDGGLFVQWLQIYEMTPALLATVVAALELHFSDYELWQANDGDLLIVASHNGRVPRPDAAAFANPRLRANLERYHLRNLDDLLMHRIGGRAALGPYFAMFGVEPNSDFHPVLEQRAPAARFCDGSKRCCTSCSGAALVELSPAVRPSGPRALSGARSLAAACRAREQAAPRRSPGDRRNGRAGGTDAAFCDRPAAAACSLLECRLEVTITPSLIRTALTRPCVSCQPAPA